MSYIDPDFNLLYGPSGQTISGGGHIQLNPEQYEYTTASTPPITGGSASGLVLNYCSHGYISGTCSACDGIYPWPSIHSPPAQDGVFTKLMGDVTDSRIEELENQVKDLQKSMEQVTRIAQEVVDLQRESENTRKIMAKALCERKPKPPEPDYAKHGQRVWLKSTGAGPFVTIRQVPVKVGPTATAVGWAIRDTRGKFHEAPDEDLTLNAPLVARRPRKWLTPLNVVSLIAIAQATYIVWGFFSGV